MSTLEVKVWRGGADGEYRAYSASEVGGGLRAAPPV